MMSRRDVVLLAIVLSATHFAFASTPLPPSATDRRELNVALGSAIAVVPPELKTRIDFPEGVTGERLLAALRTSRVTLVSISSSLPEFTATYVTHDGESAEDALLAFATDIEHIRADLLKANMVSASTYASSPTLVFHDIGVQVPAGSADPQDLAAFLAAGGVRSTTHEAGSKPVAEGTVHPTDNYCSDGATVPSASSTFVPPTGYVSYNASAKELWSYFSWADTTWTTSHGKVSYEHDIVVSNGFEDFVKWGPGTWATNLPNPYRDDTTFDNLDNPPHTDFTIGSYPATVSAGVTYFVRIPIQTVNASRGPRPLYLHPALGSWENRACERLYCWVLAPEPLTSGACIFSDFSSNDLRFYRDRSATSPLFSRINFDLDASWSYNWDKSFGFDEKTCSSSMYRGEYYNDTIFDGRLARYVRCDTAINFAWGSQSPGLGIGNDQFGVRWARRAAFTAGPHSFFVKSDDGVKFWIDDALKLDAWYESGTTGSTVNATLSDGPHDLKLEYYENGGDAHVLLQVQQAAPTAPSSVVASSPSSGQIVVRWTDASADETYFSVELKPPNGAWDEIKTVAKNATSTTISTLNPGSNYGVRLRACNNAGCSKYSNEAFTTVQGSVPSNCFTLTAYGNPTAGGYPAINTPFNCNNIGFTNGTAIGITAIHYTGYIFTDWTPSNCTLASSNSVTTTCTVTGGGSVSVTANFAAVATTTGTINVSAVSDGMPWSGAMTLTLTGPNSSVQNIASVPTSVALPAPGTYTLSYLSGGPAGHMVSGITPSATQGLPVGSTVDFVISFTPSDPAVLVAGLNVPNHVAVDDSSVYWTENWGDTGTVKKVSKSGGAVTTLASGLNRPALFVDGSYVYFSDSPGINTTSVKRVPKNGGGVVTLASGQPSVWRIAADSSYVYWTDGYGGSVRKAPIAGGSVTVLSSGLNAPSGIVLDATSVYWSESESAGRIMAAPLSGGSTTTVWPYGKSPSLVVQGQNLFWTEKLTSNDAKISKAPVAGNSLVALVSGLDNPLDLTSDGTNVYWVEDRSNGAVKQVGVDGGMIMTLADNVSHPVAIATDGAYVYWVENDGTSGTGKVKRAAVVTTPKPTVTTSASDPSGREAGPDPGQFTVSRTGSTALPLTIAYSASGSAANGVDYEYLAGIVTIPAGQATETIAVTPIDDADLESAETVILNLSTGPAYSIGDSGSASVSIADNDAVVTVSMPDSAASEVGPDTGTFTLTRTGATSETLTITFSLSGTATNGFDYAELPLTAVIPSGAASTTVIVTPVADSIAEGDEPVILSIVSSQNYRVGSPAFGTVTIADAVQPPTNVVATASGPTTVTISWNPVPGAAGYHVYRSGDALTYSLAGSPSSNTFQDISAAPNAAYLYKVRTLGSAESIDSNADLATTVIFTDAAITAAGTFVKRAHFSELLTAVNAVRALAGLSAVEFTAPVPTLATPVLRQHLIDLRTGLDEARALLGLGLRSYADPTVSVGGTAIKAVHIIDLRNGVK
ncbi:MAG: hypothetical protein QOC81_2929 [Thermoanaerobaculia bacterium]|jgi:hypothetical protein|nr:hypothetical protein [Thermoanaerobaculia bacterium]